MHGRGGQGVGDVSRDVGPYLDRAAAFAGEVALELSTAAPGGVEGSVALQQRRRMACALTEELHRAISTQLSTRPEHC